ncbi:hypothetical protein [Spiroplasma endosymbiont of Agriotes lineatus]|uniref:hypothetical protein n=1 Tax=Spiroplasma endosymbiont of Agriotes lineatus TaxID=3077930 RepID=UPI0030CE8375
MGSFSLVLDIIAFPLKVMLLSSLIVISLGNKLNYIFVIICIFSLIDNVSVCSSLLSSIILTVIVPLIFCFKFKLVLITSSLTTYSAVRRCFLPHR